MTATASPQTAHTERVRKELRKSGISSLALLRFTGRYLPKVIHENEHIKAAVFGRHKESEDLFGYTEGILVATDMRVVYLDHKPGFTTMDEIAYDVISGVNISQAGGHASLKLFTKIANYTISFANLSCVKNFADYIESQRIDLKLPKAAQPTSDLNKNEDESKTFEFLKKHDTAVLSTIDRTGNINGAVVYYLFEYGYVYILTKETTKKARNMMSIPQVALTVYDAEKLQTVQIQALAEVEQDPAIKDSVYKQIVTPHQKPRKPGLAPVTKIQGGGFIVFRMKPEQFSYSDFSE